MLKAFLKAARQALDKKDNAYCISQCESAIEVDSKSYTAYVFLGLAHTNLEEFSKAESNYRKAISLDESCFLAWQGLLSLFEKSREIPKYIDTSSRIAALHLENQDEEKCLAAIRKAVSQAKEYGNELEYAQSLRLMLPVSPFFSSVEDRLPSPAETYQKIATILEEQESAQISSAIAKGRSRLGVKLDQLTKDVKSLVYQSSQLEAVYEEIIKWSHEESIRRMAESKLLARTVDHLKISKNQDKATKLSRVMDIARGMTIVKVADALAWEIILDWSDVALERLDLPMVLDFITLFSDDKLSLALKMYIYSSVSPFSRQELSRLIFTDAQQPVQQVMGPAEVIAALTEAYDDSKLLAPLLCTRVLISLYVLMKEWSTVVEMTTILAERLLKLQDETSTDLMQVRTANNLHMGIGMAYHRAPKFHDQAMEMFDKVTSHGLAKMVNQAKLGKARILRLGGNSKAALILVAEVLLATPEDPYALLEQAECYESLGQAEHALSILETLSADQNVARETRALVHYHTAQCRRLSLAPESEIYASYVQSLRFDPNLACTYTALGTYHSDIVHDDRRASKCFQKALELDSAEVTAAERLAMSFAEDGDWDLVEIICQRVIQGNEILQVSWPYRAMGFVHVNSGDYQAAVTAFQAGLRRASDDTESWVGLGESYLGLGRHQAALKAFDRAVALNPANWYARYSIATVNSAIIEYSKACDILQELVKEGPESTNVKISLCHVHIAWSEALIRSGWISKSVFLIEQTLRIVIQLLHAQIELISIHDILGRCLQVVCALTKFQNTCLESMIIEMEELYEESMLEKDIVKLEIEQTLRSRCATLSIRAFCRYIEFGPLKAEDEAVYWYEIGRSMLAGSLLAREGDDQQPVITAFRCAVKLDPLSDAYWAALGCASVNTDAAFAHHCLIKAISLNSKSAGHWTNLGYAYLKSDHIEAANQAFLAAQTVDPSAALAWLGQGIVAHTTGESSHEIFDHAVSLNHSNSPLVAVRFVGSLVQQSALNSPEMITRALWALEGASKTELSSELTNIISYLRMLVLEYGPDERLPVERCMSLVEVLEESYESDESPETLQRYCDAKAILARFQLRKKDFENALETAASVIDLDPTDNPGTLLSCQLVAGIAQFHMEQVTEAIETLQELYESSEQDPQILRILVQALASSKNPGNLSSALEILRESQDNSDLKLLLAALIGVNGGEQKSIARKALTDLALHKETGVQEDRELIERVLEDNQSISHSQIHFNPMSSVAWANLSIQNKATNGDHCIRMALHAAEECLDSGRLARVCLESSDKYVQAVGLHLAPETRL